MKIPRSHRSRGGFALPVALLALVVVGVLVTGGFYMAQQESRIGIASQNGAMAFYIAEQGMNEVLANWSAARYARIPLWQADTTQGSIPQGDYTVSIHHLTDRMYFIESEGRVTQGGRLAGALRRMGVIAAIQTAWINPPAALTTRGTTRVGGTAQVIGGDSIPPGWSDVCADNPLENKPGVITDATGSTGTIGAGRIIGNPDTLRDPSIGDSTFLDYGELKWQDLVDLAQADGMNITALGTIPGNPLPVLANGQCDTSTPLNWGEPFRSVLQLGYVPECEDYFPLIYHEGPLRLQGSGRGQGILLVGKIAPDGTMSGDLDLRGDFEFNGIIIVLGTFSTQAASPKIRGGVMAANADLAREDIIGGSTVQYSSCAVKQAILNNASLAKARPLEQRSWVDLSNTGG
jgi:hypothetical protein